MTLDDLENAKRRALGILDQWLDAAGIIDKSSSHYQELQSVVVDAVQCGVQAATGVTEQLDSECKAPEKGAVE
jgi:hypothetical protein